jgi:hypothetical protein
MENIYTQAVADAKAVRESAMANAKAAIQEAFEPKIKAMLKKHITESEGLEEGSFTFDYNDAEYIQQMLDDAGINAMAKPGLDSEEVEIHGDAKALNKAKRILQKDGFDLGMDETYGHKGMEEEYDEYEETMSPNKEATPNELDETSLDEILAELDELDEADEIEEAETELEEAYEMEEAKKEEEEEETETETEEDEDGEEESEESTEETKVVDITLGDLVDAIKAAMASETPAPETADDDISLDEILAELEDEMEEAAGSGDYMDEAKKKHKAKEEEKMKAEKELEEAKKAIETMRAELNEVNLLNAKLLYVNKIFKSKSLTEAQKVKVLNAFDKATTVKEVKNTYSIISESMTAAPKKQLKESYGFASKPAGVAPKANTVESDPFIARMQKLAGL